MQKCVDGGKLIVDLVEQKNSKLAEPKFVEAAGMVDPFRTSKAIRVTAPAGSTVYEILEKSCDMSKVRRRHIKFFTVQVGRRDFSTGTIEWTPVHQQAWKKRRVQEGELLRFRLLPKGGGDSGKNPLAALLMIVVAVVAVAVSSFVGGLALSMMPSSVAGVASSAAYTGAQIIGGIAGLAVTTVGMALVNAIAPVRSSSSDMTSRQASPTYGLSAGKNSINQWGRVPVPLGIGKWAPPKAAISYTTVINEDQYLHELLCLGIGDVDISDITIGETPITEYVDAEFEYYKYDPTKKNYSNLFPTGVIQEDLSVELTHNVANTRTTTYCDSANIDLSFNGLGYFRDDGGIDNRTIQFVIQYRDAESTTSWEDIPNYRYFGATIFSFSQIMNLGGTARVVISPTNGVHLISYNQDIPQGYHQLGVYSAYYSSSCYTQQGGENDGQVFCDRVYNIRKTQGSDIPSTIKIQGFTDISIGESGTLSGSRETSINISGGYIADMGDYSTGGSSFIEVSGSTVDLLRRTFPIYFPKPGMYDIAVRRVTVDHTDQKEVTKSYWSSLRSLSTDNPINTPYPVNILAIKLKASGQLSGSLDNVFVNYSTKILDWDNSTSSWIHRNTSNPASMYRHVLQDKIALARPQSEDVIDFESIQEAHEFWGSMNWTFNMVFDDDASVFERLQDLCAAGLASPTMHDGSWAIVKDVPRTTIDAVFTESNSFNWSFSRNTVRLPNEIQVNFVNEEHWGTDTMIVATDEKVGDNYIFETQSLRGVTNPNQVYHLTRHHYADAKLHIRNITFRSYDESLMCTRGSLVQCSVPSVTPKDLQNGRIKRYEINSDGDVIRISTDQAQEMTTSGRRFGVKIINALGDIYHAEIQPENTRTYSLRFVKPIKMDIEIGNKYIFGDYEELGFFAIVTGMQFNSDWTCDITAQDYTPELYNAIYEEVPPFQSVITPEVTVYAFDLKAWEVWKYDGASYNGHSSIQVQWAGNRSSWNVFTSINGGTPKLHGVSSGNTYVIDPAEMYKEYRIFVTPYAVSTNAPYVTVNTRGKDAPPSDVTGFVGAMSENTLLLSWNHIPDVDLKGYEIRYGQSWGKSELISNSISDNTYLWTPPVDGTYRFLIKAIDTSGNYSINATEFILGIEVEHSLNIVKSFDEFKEGLEDATYYNLHLKSDRTEIAWTPSITNMYEPNATNLAFDTYSGSKKIGMYTSKVWDLGIVSQAHLRIVVDWEAPSSGFGATNLSYPDRTNLTYPKDTNLSLTEDVSVIIEYRTSEDNDIWTTWTPYRSTTTIKGQFYQLRVTFTDESIYTFIKITRMESLVDVPDKIVLLKEEVIPVEGKTYILQDIAMFPIYVKYIVGVTTLGVAGKYAVVEKYEDRFTVQVFNDSGLVGGVVDLDIRGF